MTETQFTPAQFDNLIKMGASPDQENHLLALSLIETVNFEDHMVYILLLKKLGKISDAFWIDNCKEIYDKMQDVIDLTSTLTFKKIFEVLATKKVNPEQMQFFLDYFADYLKSQCTALGYTFVKDLEIKIKTDADQSGNISKG